MKNKNILMLGLGGLVIVLGAIYYLNFRTVTVSFTQKIGPGIAPINVKVGDTIKEIGAPGTSDEYEFMGWYLNGEKFDFNTPITKNINLEAKWEKIKKIDNQL